MRRGLTGSVRLFPIAFLIYCAWQARSTTALGLVIQSPAGAVTIGKNHHATMNMFLAKTERPGLVTVRALGEIAPKPGCKSDE